MFNRLHARWRRLETGWNPVPTGHAASYSELELGGVDLVLLDDLDARVSGLTGRIALDLRGLAAWQAALRLKRLRGAA